MVKKDEARRIIQLNPMDELLIDELAKKDEGKTESKQKSTSWYIAIDYKDETDLDHDYGTKSFPLSRVALLDADRKIPSYMLPSYIDDMIFGDLQVSDGHYCFTTTERGETIKYGCPTQNEGELVPLVNTIYVDNTPSTADTIQYRYDSDTKTFVVIPQSLKLIDGNGTQISYTGSVGSETYKQQVNIVLDEPKAATGSTIIELQNNKLLHTLSGVTQGSYGTGSSPTLDFGSTFNIPYFTVNPTGHVTAASNVQIKIPDTAATDAVFGIVKLGTSSKWIGSENSAGTSTTVARADHVHGSSSLVFGSSVATYSPSAASNTTITSSHLLNVVRGTTSVPTLLAYFGTVDPGEYEEDPTYTYTTGNVNASLCETNNNNVLLLAGSTLGSGVSGDKTGVVLGSGHNTTLLLAAGDSYVTNAHIYENDDNNAAMTFALTRVPVGKTGVNRIFAIKNWWSASGHRNYMYIGNNSTAENVFSFMMHGYGSTDSTTSFVFHPTTNNVTYSMPTNLTFNGEDKLKPGCVLYVDSISGHYSPMDDYDVKLAWKKVDDIMPIQYLVSNIATSEQSITVTTNASYLSYPSSYTTNELEVSNGYVNGIDFMKPQEVTLGLAVMNDSTPYADAMFALEIGAYVTDVDGTSSSTVTLGKITVDRSEEGWQFYDITSKFNLQNNDYYRMKIYAKAVGSSAKLKFSMTHFSVNNIM